MTQELEKLQAQVQALAAKVDQLAAQLAASQPSPQPAIVTDHTIRPADPIPANAAKDKALDDAAKQLDEDIRALQEYSYEMTGRRNYAHPTNVDPELLATAREWFKRQKAA